MEQRMETIPPRHSALKAAFPVTIPVLTGYLCLGMTFGVLMRTIGYGAGWAALMSLICFAGSIQFLAITLLTTVFDPQQAFFLSLMVNARHIFYGLSMLEKYRGLGKVRAYLIFALTDETYSLISSVEPPPGIRRRPFYVWISLLNHSYWVGGTILGNLLGGVLPFNTRGMDFALTALFVVLFMEQWKNRENRGAGVIGIACAVVSLVVMGPGNLVITAMVLILVVLLGGRNRLCT